MAVVSELVSKFSFTGSLKPLDNLNAGLTSGIGNIAKAVGAFGAVGVALNGFLANTLANADAQVQLARETGVSIESLQELGFVAEQNGSSAGAMEKSIVGLEKAIGNASINGSADFSKLGISVRDANGNVKDAETMFYEVSDAMKTMGLTASEQRGMMGKLGIDESLIQTMRLTSKEMGILRSKAKALGTISTEDGKKIVQFNDSLSALKFGASSLQKSLAIAFAPQLTEVADGFTDMLIANKDMIKNGLKKFFEMVNLGLGAIVRFGKMLYNLIDGTVGFENALMLAGAGMLYLNRAMLMNPVGLIVAGIVGLIVVFDDLMNGIDGGQSVIADFFNEFFGVDIIPFIKSIGEAFSAIPSIVSSAFTTSKDFIFKIIDEILEYFKPVLEMFNKITDFELPSLGDVSNTATDAVDSVGSFFSGLNPFSDGNDTATPQQLATSTVGNSSQSSNTTNDIKIEIKTDNPELAGQSVNNELQGMLKNANSLFNKGGR